MIAYLKAIVRLKGKGRQGIGLEVFRAEAAEDEDVDLTQSEEESIGEVSASTAIMRVYEEIGEDFFTGKGITAKKFAKQLDELGAGIKHLNVHINCLGGDCFTAQAIHNIIRDYSCEKRTSYIDGVCASAATVIACASDEVVARSNTNYMVHLPWAVCIGNSSAMRDAANQLDTLTIPIVNVYKDQVKGRIREAKIRALMEAETWMTAEEAMDYGFVDKIKGRINPIARVNNNLMINGKLLDVGKYHYQNIPDYPVMKKGNNEMVETDKPLTKEDLEKSAPGLMDTVRAEARKAERDRLVALEAMKPRNGPNELIDLIEAAKADGRQPQDIAMECYNISKTTNLMYSRLDAMRKDGEFSVPAGDAPSSKTETKSEKGAGLLAKAFAAQRKEVNHGKSGTVR